MRHILCNYYVTYKCNASCAFCEFSDHAKYRHSPHARLEDFRDNLPHLKKAGVRIIDFTGGEPLLNTALPDMLTLARQANMLTTITTNCLLYPKRGESIRGLVDLLHFSLDSFDPERHNSIRGADCFNHVMLSIEKALSLGEKPDILFTVTRENFREIEDVYRFTRKLRLILILNPVFPYFKDEPLPEDALTAMEQHAKKPYVYLSRGFIKLRREGGNNTKKPVCRAVSRTIAISPDNELLLPCFHRHVAKIPVDGDLTKAMQSELYKEYQAQQGRLPFCENCVINCYFEPSFALSLNRFMWSGLSGKLTVTIL